MGQSNQHRFDEEFRREAVRLSYEPGRSVAKVAQELGIGESTLTAWRRRLRGSVAPEAGNASDNPETELRRLRKELEVVRMERDILKKAVAYFAKESR